MLTKSERTAEPNAVNLLCSVKQGSDFKARFSGFLSRRVCNARNPGQVTIPGGPDPGVRGPDLGPQKRQEMATFRQKVPFRDRNSPKSSVFDRLLTDLDTRIVNFWTFCPEIGDSGSADRSCRGFPKGGESWENAWQSDELSVLWHLLGRYYRHLPAACNIITGIHASSLLSSQRKT